MFTFFFSATLLYMVYYNDRFSAQDIAIIIHATEDYIEQLINQIENLFHPSNNSNNIENGNATDIMQGNYMDIFSLMGNEFKLPYTLGQKLAPSVKVAITEKRTVVIDIPKKIVSTGAKCYCFPLYDYKHFLVHILEYYNMVYIYNIHLFLYYKKFYYINLLH